MKKKLFSCIIALFFSCIIIMQCNNSVYAAETTGLINGSVYNLTNKASSKCLNVNYGTDENGTNVTQFTQDGTIEQRFKLVYNGSRDSYKLYAMCSSNGTNRVLDIYRPIQSGANVDIWTPDDNDAQDLIITDRGNGYYSIHPRYNTSLALTSNGTNNGSGVGTSSSSAGNVYVDSYYGTDNQLWTFKGIAECYFALATNEEDRSPTNNYTGVYTRQMGYNYYSHVNGDYGEFLNWLKSSGIFVYHAHGKPGALIFDGTNEVTASQILTLPDNSLSTELLVLNYSCYGATTPSGGTSILDAIYNRGAQCAVSWNRETYIIHVNNWNELFFEKIYNTKETIVEGFRHADYWIDEACGTFSYEVMNGARVERGNIYNYLYR